MLPTNSKARKEIIKENEYKEKEKLDPAYCEYRHSKKVERV